MTDLKDMQIQRLQVLLRQVRPLLSRYSSLMRKIEDSDDSDSYGQTEEESAHVDKILTRIDKEVR
jgi:hypothetical protein